MPKQIRVTRTVAVSFTVILVISLSLLAGAWLFVDYGRSQNDFLEISQTSIASYQLTVKQAVDEAYNYSQSMLDRTEERARLNVQHRVDEAVATANGIVRALSGTVGLNQMKTAVREALRPLRFFDGEGYFFAVSMDGVEQLYPIRPEFEGQNLLDLQDERGNYAIRDEMEVAGSQGSGFVQHYWVKPDGEIGEKISFVRYFEPFDWYFGTGIYLDTVENEIQEEVLSRLAGMELVNDGYMFAGQFDGLSLLGPNSGLNMLDFVDEDGVAVVQELIRLARDGSGFLTYTPPDNTGYPSSAKVSFVRGLDEWEWYIGAGVQVSEIEELVDQRREELASDVRRKLLVLAGLYVIVTGLALTGAALITRRLKRSIAIFTDFFTRAATSHEKIDPDQLPFVEARQLAINANLMVDDYLENQSALLEKESELQRSRQVESLGGLAAAIAHDFNNLLTVILGNISLVRSDLDGHPQLDEQLADAEVAAGKAKDLSVQMLTFSKGGAPDPHPANTAQLLTRGVSFALKGTNVVPDFAIPDDILPVLVDEKQFSQVINNLVVNACQAMPEGGTLRIEAASQSGRLPGSQDNEPIVRIAFTDTGPGISREDGDRIFDPYFTTKEIGTGLGLATVKSIIVKHGGSIRANPSYSDGAQFVIRLPASDQPPDPQELDSGDETPETHLMSGRVLVMDDDDPVRALATRMLARLGFDVSGVPNGEAAIDEYRGAMETGRPFDYVVLDLTVNGGMGGLECLRHLKKIDPEVRAVVASGYSEDAVISQPRRHGFLFALQKPFRFADLQRSFESMVAYCDTQD